MASEFAKRLKEDLIRDITALGSLFSYLLLMLFFLVLNKYKVFIKLLIGFVLIYIATILIRLFYFKDRPKKYPHSSFIDGLDASSFPSLHAERTSFLSLLLMNYFDNVLISILLILIVILVSFSRVYLKKHDKADVIAGLAIGALVYLVVDSVV